MTFPTSLRRLAALAAGLAAAVPALASPITSTTDPSLAGATVYDFSDLPSNGAILYSTIAIPGAGEISDGGAARMYLNSSGGFLPSPTLYTGSTQVIRFDFAYDLAAFAFEWLYIDYSVQMDAYDAADNLLESLNIPAAYPDLPDVNFSGLADAGIRSVTLSALDSAGNPGYTDNYLIDNLTYVAGPPGDPETVPEPATPALTLTALAGAALATRRARSAR